MRLTPLLLTFALTAPAAAAPVTVDFSQGPLGDLGTTTTTVDGVTVQAYGGNLYRWRGEYCCNHIDLGFGVLGPTEGLNNAEPELDYWESIRLTKPDGYSWVDITFSSVNDGSRGYLYEGLYPMNGQYIATALADANYFQTLSIINPLAPYLWVMALPGYGGANSFFLAANVRIEPTSEVPEPATLALLGTGLLGFVWRRRALGDCR